jgi:hypothetical protein
MFSVQAGVTTGGCWHISPWADARDSLSRCGFDHEAKRANVVAASNRSDKVRCYFGR